MSTKTKEEIIEVIEFAFTCARKATTDYLEKYGERNVRSYGLQEMNWVTVKPANSRVAKILKENYQATVSDTGGVRLYNPGNAPSYCITANNEGSWAFASILKEQLDINISVG